jgi:hypothetical protein
LIDWFNSQKDKESSDECLEKARREEDSLEVQSALGRIQESEQDSRIVTLAGAVLLELAMDGMENEANKAHRRVTGSNPSSKIPPGSNTNLRVDSASSPWPAT